MSNDICDERLDLKTVESQALAIDASGSPVKVNGATVIKAHIAADNGGIQVIDKVLLPR